MLPWEQPSRDDIRTLLRDPELYRARFLKVRPASGGERIPFIRNNPQRVLHARLEEEKRIFGRVRALIPKARRMGVSTEIGGRFFQRVATEFGRRAQVVAHRADAAAKTWTADGLDRPDEPLRSYVIVVRA